MARNYWHLAASVTSFVLFLYHLLLGSFFIAGISISAVFLTPYTYILILPFALNIIAGIMQLVYEHKDRGRYVGWHTLFLFPFLIPTITSLVMYFRHGLSARQRHKAMQKWYIENFDKLAKHEVVVKRITPALRYKLSLVNELQSSQVLDSYEANKYKLRLLTGEIPMHRLPKIFTPKELVATYRDN